MNKNQKIKTFPRTWLRDALKTYFFTRYILCKWGDVSESNRDYISPSSRFLGKSDSSEKDLVFRRL